MLESITAVEYVCDYDLVSALLGKESLCEMEDADLEKIIETM